MSTDICTEDVIVQITSPQGGTTANVTGRLNPGSNGSDLGRKLLLAAKNGDTNNVLSLMAAGAPFSTDWLGTSALHLAAGAGHADTAAVLLRAGAVRDARTKVDRTPLHVAAGGGHTDVVKLLLQHGALVDCRDMLRMCPLHWAARRGQAGAAAALLAAGADRSAADKFGLRPADLAARAGHRALAALLRPGPHEKTAKPPDPPTFETVPKLQEITITSIPEAKKAKLNPPIEEMKIKPEPEIEGGDSEQGADTSEVPGAAWSLDAGAALLARHGITLLPRDHPHTVLAALRAGRTLVLSDAGKLLLKEAASATNLDLPAPPPPAPPAPTPTHNLQNKIIFTPANIGDMQIKYVQVPREAAPASPSVEAAPARPRPVLLNYNVRAAAPPAPAPAAGRQPVKIIMNKANFKKLIANKNAAAAHAQLAAPAPGPAPSSEAASLRAELAAARAAVSQLTQELARTKQLLARRDL